MITELQARAAKPREKSYMLRDSRGLYLRIDSSGKKYFIYRYWEAGKEHQKSFGPYPLVSLADAREQRDAIAAARRRGESPKTRPTSSTLFGELAAEWQKIKLAALSSSYQKATSLRLKSILPTLANRPVDKITPAEILSILRKIEFSGRIDTARRVKMLLGQIFRYGIASGQAQDDPTRALTGALQSWKQRHYAASIDPRTLAQALKMYPYSTVRCVMLFQLLTVSRPGEARMAEWSEINGDVWKIPAVKMKARREHVVFLSPQVLELLEGLREFNTGRYIFQSLRGDRPVSPEAGRVALRSMGFSKEIITPHGFRALFSTWANERGANPDVIEACLAHQTRGVRAAYNHAQWKEERKELLSEWANFLLN